MSKKQKPTLAKGTRDYSPEVMLKRNYILDIIRSTFQKYGFLPLETPAIENLSVLMGKYGDEGDKLLFKILNSGDFLKKTTPEDYDLGHKSMLPKIAEKGLRYDLTVPFARFVTMNQSKVAMPFRRYQIQAVWRGDAPQKGRYREFYQCDADVVGASSMICEAEIVMMINEVLTHLQLPSFDIKINNRKILRGIAEVVGAQDQETDLLVAIDKLDKIGKDKVIEEIQARGISTEATQKMLPIFDLQGDNASRLTFLDKFLSGSEVGQKGLEELRTLLDYVQAFTGQRSEEDHILLDITLARGLSYYTGAIFEVTTDAVKIGSISGGGRYDDLTSTFGLKDVTGVGFSFGLDRIYDVLEELSLFPKDTQVTSKVLFANFDKDRETERYILGILQKLREQGINSEVYPKITKLDKQLKYANKKNIPFVIMVGSEERKESKFTLKNMVEGTQEVLSLDQMLSLLST